MAKKRSAQLDAEIREALAQIPKKPSLKTRAQLDAEIDEILGRGLAAERYEVANALGFRYPKAAPHKTLTDTNLLALKEMVIKHGGPVFPNRVAAVDAPHLKRTIAFGLAEAAPGGMIRLTEKGRDMVTQALEQDLARERAHTPSISSVVKPEFRDAALARERAKHETTIEQLERALTQLRR